MTIPANNIQSIHFRQHRNQPKLTAGQTFSLADEMFYLGTSRSLSDYANAVKSYAGIWKFHPSYGNFDDYTGTYQTSAVGGTISIGTRASTLDGYSVTTTNGTAGWATYSKIGSPVDFPTNYAGDYTLILLNYSAGVGTTASVNRFARFVSGFGSAGDSYIGAEYHTTYGVYLVIRINNIMVYNAITTSGTTAGTSLVISKRGAQTSVWRNGTRVANNSNATVNGSVPFNTIVVGAGNAAQTGTSALDEMRLLRWSLYDPAATTITPPTTFWG